MKNFFGIICLMAILLCSFGANATSLDTSPDVVICVDNSLDVSFKVVGVHPLVTLTCCETSPDVVICVDNSLDVSFKVVG